MFKRCLALLLCLFLLPAGALADAYTGPSVIFDLRFDMDPEAYPASMKQIAPGVADLMNALTLEGQFTEADGRFELTTDLLLSAMERTRTHFRVFGSEANWHIQSSLLGDETLTVTMENLLEFALKADSHLGVPLQRVAIWASPYLHTHPLDKVIKGVKSVLFAEEGARTVAKDDLMELALLMREHADSNVYFRIWAQAVAMETGYDEYLMDLMYNMPDWVETYVPESGLTVTVDDASQTWTTNALTLLRWETDQSGAQMLSFALPPLAGEGAITLDAALQPDGDLLHGSLDLTIDDEEGETLLSLHADGSLPAALPVTRAFSFAWDAEGPFVGGDGVHLRFEGEPTATGVVLRQLTPDLSKVMLTVTADLEATEAEFTPKLEGDPFYVLSVNSDSLNELMHRIASPMIRGLLPLIAQAPTSSCQTLMNLLEDSGVFAMLTDGFSGDGDGWDNDWDDDWDEDWDDDWDEDLDDNWWDED